MQSIMLTFGIRPEALETGIIRLVGTDKDNIVVEASRFINEAKYYIKGPTH